MANPFRSKFKSSCGWCDTEVSEGDDMFAHEGEFICIECAVEANLVCECGNYKKEAFNTCYSCAMDGRDIADDTDDGYDPFDVPI